MCEGQVIQGIAGGILAIVGILLAISGGNLWGRKQKWSIALGIALAGVGLFMLITSFPQYAIGFSVLATLALAFAAFQTIKEADAREERRREEELAKEKRDRKERLLNEIIEWAVDVTKGELLMEFADVRGIKEIQWSRLYLYTTVDKLQFSFRQARTRGLYISGTVSILGADLQQAVGELIRNLEVHIQALKECMDAINSPACETTLYGATSAAEKTTDSKKLLDESANKVIEEATKIKTKDIS